jgi:hypothetical protein
VNDLRSSCMEKGESLTYMLQERDNHFALERHCVVVYEVV